MTLTVLPHLRKCPFVILWLFENLVYSLFYFSISTLPCLGGWYVNKTYTLVITCHLTLYSFYDMFEYVTSNVCLVRLWTGRQDDADVTSLDLFWIGK